MPNVHPTSILGKGVKLAETAVVGPHVVIDGDVSIGAGTTIGPACMIHGPAVIGEDNVFHGQSSIGGASQDKKGDGGALRIGDRNNVREFVTLNRATKAAKSTVIGSDNWIMAYGHVAHECTVGDRTVIGNLCQLGGHVQLGDGAIMGGGALVHQNCRVGQLAIVGGATAVRQDVPPYANYAALPGKVGVGVNKIALERAGRAEDYKPVAAAYKVLYRDGLTLVQAIEKISQLAREHGALQPLVDFLVGVGSYGIVRPRRYGAGGD